MIPEPDLLGCIIHDYLQGCLTAEEAAQEIHERLGRGIDSFYIEVTPSIRPILSELRRLQSGHPLPPTHADPKRHANGNLDMLDGAEERLWTTAIEHEMDDQPVSLRCTFYAATEAAARRVADWLQILRHAVEVQTPSEADADDWVVTADSPAAPISRERLTVWVESLRSVPLRGEASLGGFFL